MKQTKKGFTLVELLVVIAILAILATVSVIGYTAFINKAHESNAKTELHQVASQIEADMLLDGIWESEDGTVRIAKVHTPASEDDAAKDEYKVYVFVHKTEGENATPAKWDAVSDGTFALAELKGEFTLTTAGELTYERTEGGKSVDNIESAATCTEADATATE